MFTFHFADKADLFFQQIILPLCKIFQQIILPLWDLSCYMKFNILLMKLILFQQIILPLFIHLNIECPTVLFAYF